MAGQVVLAAGLSFSSILSSAATACMLLLDDRVTTDRELVAVLRVCGRARQLKLLDVSCRSLSPRVLKVVQTLTFVTKMCLIQCALHDAAMIALGRALAEPGGSIQSLNVSQNPFGQPGLMALADLCLTSSSLEAVFFYGVRVAPADMRMWHDVANITSVVTRNETLDADEYIRGHTLRNQVLTATELRVNIAAHHDPTVCLFETALRDTIMLRTLTLEQLTTRTAERVSNGIANNTSIKRLVVCDTAISATELAKTLVTGVRANQSIEELRLDGVHVNVSVIRGLHWSHVSVLRLMYVNLTIEGLQCVLPMCDQLHTLGLAGNRLGPLADALLGDMLETNTSLLVLELYDTALQTVASIADALSINECLRTLNVSYCLLSKGDICALLDAIRDRSVFTLALHEQDMDVGTEITTLLRWNPTMVVTGCVTDEIETRNFMHETVVVPHIDTVLLLAACRPRLPRSIWGYLFLEFI